jgi:hypothetical protein
MKWKYVWKEIWMNPVMLILIFIQSLIVFAMLISMISVITSRYARFREVKDLLDGEGEVANLVYLNYYDSSENSKLSTCVQDSKVAEQYMKNCQVSACYDWTFGLEGDEQDMVLTTYDEKLWKCHQPEMASGRWFEDSDSDTETMEIVIAQKGGNSGKYHVGDMIQASEELVDSSAAKTDKKKMEFKVIGIIKEGASILGENGTDTEDYRSLFWNYSGTYENKMYVFGLHSDMYHYKMTYALKWFTKMGGLTFFSWNDGDNNTISDNQEYLMENGMYISVKEFTDIRNNSVQYIFEQIKLLLPILLSLILLTIVSVVSNTAILLRQNRMIYAIYYMNGLTWKECTGIHVKNIFFTQGIILLITWIGVLLCKLSGRLEDTVISLGIWQAVGCMLVVCIYVLCGMTVAFRHMKHRTAKDILREAK